MALIKELEKLKKKYTGGYWIDEKHPFIDDWNTLVYHDPQDYEKAQEALNEVIEIVKKNLKFKLVSEELPPFEEKVLTCNEKGEYEIGYLQDYGDGIYMWQFPDCDDLYLGYVVSWRFIIQ